MISLQIPSPKSYLNTSKTVPVGSASGRCVVAGTVTHLVARDGYLRATVSDGTGSAGVVFFRYSNYHLMSLRVGSRVILSGDFKNGEVVHPKIIPLNEAGRIKAVYSQKGVTARKVMKMIDSLDDGADPVPEHILIKRGLPGLKETYRMLHFPRSMDEVELARWRLAYTELYAEMSRYGRCIRTEGIAIDVDRQKVSEYIELAFSFRLTEGQMRVVHEILDDLSSQHAMRRILIGDVGSGKTEIAIIAAYAAILGGYRVLYLCPTEVVAVQTYHRVARALAGRGYVALYTAREKVKKATPDVIVGTHALLYNGWQYHKVGLTIIDEQHKFGVRQRDSLIVEPECNLLEMTATPIPRSYAMFVQNIMDVSILAEMPYKRDVETRIIAVDRGMNRPAGDEYSRVLDLIDSTIQSGRQVLVIYPSIESQRGGMKAATDAFRYWASRYGSRAALLHGRVKDKETILKRFAGGEISLLVSTTASEVGIDVAGLTVCVVVNAERFGLCQLHQIRGRVGRRGDRGHFILICKNSKSIDRLAPLLELDRGCDIAEADTRQRGFGVIAGDTQSGHFFNYFTLNDVEIASLVRDDLQEQQDFSQVERPVQTVQ